MIRPGVHVAWLAATLCVLGCSTAPMHDPMAVMLDRSRDPVQRLAAAKQLGPITQSTDPQATAKAMHSLLWSDGQPTDLRLLAMDRLIDYDEDAFWRVAQRRIVEVDNWEVLRPLINHAVNRGDPALTVMLIRSYVRESHAIPDAQRPEHDAIAAINSGKTVEQAIWDVLVSEDDSINIGVRVDAWTLTNRLSGSDHARSQVMQASSDLPVIRDLQAANWLGRLPDNREGVLWLMRLRSEAGRSFWNDAHKRAEALSDEQRQGLELRHLPLLQLATKQQLASNREQLLSHVAHRLPSEPAAVRTSTGVMLHLPSESFGEHAEALCWGDLLAIDILLDAIQDRPLVSDLFAQADADLADTTTEHGGVLVFENGRYVPLLFPPSIRMHDQKFYSSDALIQRMYTGLFHYHFHAQQHHNADYAGPGAGDLLFAEMLRPSAVVFTFLDQNTLGVDYYQPGGIVIDLGVIQR